MVSRLDFIKKVTPTLSLFSERSQPSQDAKSTRKETDLEGPGSCDGRSKQVDQTQQQYQQRRRTNRPPH